MKTAVQYLSDNEGKTHTVQLSISKWTRLMNRLSKYEQMLMLKSDLTRSFEEVKKMRLGKIKKQPLHDFLNGI